MPLRQRLRPVTTVAGAAVLVLVLTGCGGDNDAASSTTTTEVATAETSTSAPVDPTSTTVPVATTLVAPTTTAGGPATTVDGNADLVPDGTSFGYLTAIDISGSAVTIDIAELLTGDAAVKAAVADGALDPGETSIDNDYYIRNKNPKLRVAPVAETAPINVLSSTGSPDLESGSLVDLATSLTAYPSDGGPKLPVQIVASGGTITRIDEVFFP